jgi:hypothetical protein
VPGGMIRRSSQNFLTIGLTGYQLIQIPRRDSDPPDGRIELSISDGALFYNNIWKETDRIIEKFKPE